jgi:hypothetical protein
VPSKAIGDSALGLVASKQEGQTASPIGESGCELELVSLMKEMSFKQDCPVRAVGITSDTALVSRRYCLTRSPPEL